MCGEPILRATGEPGFIFEDPSEDALWSLLEELEEGEGTFIIVERTDVRADRNERRRDPAENF